MRNRTSVLLKAIENKKYVNFFYTPVSKSKYVLKRDQIPLKVSLKDGFYYLTCTQDGLKDTDIRLKSYRIDLISDLVVHKEIYAIDETTKDELEFTEAYSPGVFTVNKRFEINFGTSSRKLSQDIKQSLITSIVGATGLGFSYQINTLTMGYGSFVYNNGVIIHGLEIGIPF